MNLNYELRAGGPGLSRACQRRSRPERAWAMRRAAGLEAGTPRLPEVIVVACDGLPDAGAKAWAPRPGCVVGRAVGASWPAAFPEPDPPLPEPPEPPGLVPCCWSRYTAAASDWFIWMSC